MKKVAFVFASTALILAATFSSSCNPSQTSVNSDTMTVDTTKTPDSLKVLDTTKR